LPGTVYLEGNSSHFGHLVGISVISHILTKLLKGKSCKVEVHRKKEIPNLPDKGLVDMFKEG
jgi:hypothetical protein